jgi:hypothetical protein
MPEIPQNQNPVNSVISEFGTRLNEIEEKQRLLKDRLLLVGENLVSTKEEYEAQLIDFKNQLKQLDFDLKNLRQLAKRITENLDDFARKSELEILNRQIKMFQPLEFARIQDIKNLVREELKNQKKSD